MFGFNKINMVLFQVTRLSGIKVLGLSMGMSHTLLVTPSDTPEQQEKLESFKVFDP